MTGLVHRFGKFQLAAGLSHQGNERKQKNDMAKRSCPQATGAI